MRERLPDIAPWRARYEGACDDFCESVFFTGNGALGVRGFPAWRRKTHPQQHAVFRAGLFTEIKPGVTDMVQLPDAFTLEPDDDIPEAFSQELDFHRGALTHACQTERARTTLLRIVSMADKQLVCQRLTVTALKTGDYAVRAVADSRVVNLPVHDDQTVENTQTVPLLTLDAISESGFALSTRDGGRRATYLWSLAPSLPCERRAEIQGGVCVTTFRARLIAGETLTLEQRVRVLTDDEAPNAEQSDPFAAHYAAWEALWADCDVQIDGDDALQGALRYNIYQMLCNCHEDDPSVSIGARGLTHGRYKGNTFWDTDIFLFPFFLWQRPAAARSLAQYRVSLLPDAEALAKKQNLDGARYPWMCATTGAEQCESWDIGLCETHVTADVCYALSRYGEVTGDKAFMERVRPVYAQTARYWRSRLTYEPEKDRYSLFFVKGPDEYCGAAVNNTYTCYLAKRNLLLGAEALGGAEGEALRAVAERVTILYDHDRDLYLQDETFDRLEPAPFLKSGASPMYKQVCFDRMQRYRVLKQADLVQLMTLYPEDFTARQKANVFDAYEPLTLHDSSLSFGAHALLAFQIGRMDKALDYLRRSVFLDLTDGMENTGHEGVHMAALGASWQAVVFGMLGLWSERGKLTISPRLPAHVRRVSLRVHYRGKCLRVTATRENATIEEE